MVEITPEGEEETPKGDGRAKDNEVMSIQIKKHQILETGGPDDV